MHKRKTPHWKKNILESASPPSPGMNSSYMVLHVIHATEDTPTTCIFARNLRIMLSFVPCTILLTRETAFGSLGATFETAEKMFPVSIIMFAQVACAPEYGFGSTSRVPTTPCLTQRVHNANFFEVLRSRRRSSAMRGRLRATTIITRVVQGLVIFLILDLMNLK